MQQISISSLGQASAVCSKSPNLPLQEELSLNFACSKDYFVSSVISSGIQSYDPTSEHIS